MIPTLLITLRETIEASLIVATILGMLVKLNQPQKIKTVWIATFWALATSFLLVFGGSMIGVNFKHIYTPATEGVLYIVSALFITWAVFSLHNRLGRKKIRLSQGIFMLTFTTVLREGIEIALFLSTIYFTSTPYAILTGFVCGIILGIGISFLFFSATIHIPVHFAFRVSNFLLIIFSGSLLAKGIGEFPIHTVSTLPVIAALTYIFFMHRWVFEVH